MLRRSTTLTLSLQAGPRRCHRLCGARHARYHALADVRPVIAAELIARTMLGKSLSDLTAGAVAAHRLELFLTQQVETRKWDNLDRASGRVGFGDGAEFAFDAADPDSFRLGPLDLEFPLGKLSIICGAIVRQRA